MKKVLIKAEYSDTTANALVIFIFTTRRMCEDPRRDYQTIFLQRAINQHGVYTAHLSSMSLPMQVLIDVYSINSSRNDIGYIGSATSVEFAKKRFETLLHFEKNCDLKISFKARSWLNKNLEKTEIACPKQLGRLVWCQRRTYTSFPFQLTDEKDDDTLPPMKLSIAHPFHFSVPLLLLLNNAREHPSDLTDASVFKNIISLMASKTDRTDPLLSTGFMLSFFFKALTGPVFCREEIANAYHLGYGATSHPFKAASLIPAREGIDSIAELYSLFYTFKEQNQDTISNLTLVTVVYTISTADHCLREALGVVLQDSSTGRMTVVAPSLVPLHFLEGMDFEQPDGIEHGKVRLILDPENESYFKPAEFLDFYQLYEEPLREKRVPIGEDCSHMLGLSSEFKAMASDLIPFSKGFHSNEENTKSVKSWKKAHGQTFQLSLENIHSVSILKNPIETKHDKNMFSFCDEFLVEIK